MAMRLVKLSLAGGLPVMLKLAALWAAPLEVVMLMGPVPAPAGTAAVSWVLDTFVKVEVPTPENFTALVLLKFVPLMVTSVPTPPLAGLKPVMTGRRLVFPQ